MKKKYFTLLLLSVCFCFVQAQTTHFIDWETGVGANATITINVGDEIVWTNVESGMPHNVVSSDPNVPAGFGSGTLNFGDSYSFTFNSPVIFDYLCGFHPGTMDGTITVIAPPNCDPPTNLTIDNVTQTTANISWTASATETNGYNWAVFNSGDDPVTDTPVTDGNVATGIIMVEATGLTDNTIYDFYVLALCDNGLESDLAGPLTFTTGTLGLNSSALIGFEFYPNPVSGVIYLKAQNTIKSTTIHNVLGQKVFRQKINKNTAEINISALKCGTYFLKVIDANNNTGVFKIVKN